MMKKHLVETAFVPFYYQGVAVEGLVSPILVLLPVDRAKWRFIVMDTHRGGAGAEVI